ncbi:probable cytochrome P450 6a21 [Atheta coriaria]|uniref:probable cytochrome P450 6a21 n=1 Tax=Dalotia coriaria TaxID=877792 RepID=UPI0031F3DC13
MIIILSVIIVLLLIYQYVWPKKKYWEGRGMPTYKIKMFLSMTNVVHEMGDVYKKMKVEGQRVAGLYLTWENILLFTDLRSLENCAIVQNKRYEDKRNAQQLFDVILNSATNLIVALQESSKSDKQIDFCDVSTRYSTEMMISLAFGNEFLKVTKLCSKIREMSLRAGAFSLKTVVKQFVIDWFPQFAKRFRMSAYDSTAHKFYMKTVQEAIEYRKQSTTLRHDFLQSLLDAENDDGEKTQMTIEEIAEQVMSFFVSGVETSAVTISYSLIEIKRNLNVESKLRGEVCTILEKYNYTLHYNALEEMIYLDAVIRESLRMYPPIPILRKKTSEAFLVDNIEIEKGTPLAVSILAIQRDAEKYIEPDVFNPDRLEGNIDLDIERQHLILQSKIALALILWNFDYEIDDKTKYPLKIDAPNGILIPTEKIWVKFSPLITSL